MCVCVIFNCTAHVISCFPNLIFFLCHLQVSFLALFTTTVSPLLQIYFDLELVHDATSNNILLAKLEHKNHAMQLDCHRWSR